MDAVGGAVVEIACDESGFSGTNLLDAATPVFTHASVDLRVEEAVELIQTLRSGFRRSLNEFKSGQFLRGPQAGPALEWLLAALNGRAQVQLVDKEYFLVTRIVGLFLVEPSYAAGTRLTQDHRPAALTLYRAGRAGGRGWSVFLATFVELVRTNRRHQPDRSVVERFFQARDALAGAGLGAQAEGVLDGLSRTRVWAVLTRLARDDRSIPPPLEPMLPALAETVLFWSGGKRRVLVIHDEQSALTADRLRRLQHVLTGGADSSAADAHETATPPARVSPLAGLVTVDSRDDPRVQVADLLAGVARRSPDIGDAGLLQPFLSPTSLRDPERRTIHRTALRARVGRTSDADSLAACRERSPVTERPLINELRRGLASVDRCRRGHDQRALGAMPRTSTAVMRPHTSGCGRSQSVPNQLATTAHNTRR